MAHLQLADGVLNYQLDGPADAQVLVLSNSLGTDLGMWDEQIPAWSEHFRVLRYDTRGHGGSLVTQGPYSIEQLGGDVLALLEALDIEHAHFVGLSMGGLIGQWLGINAAPAPAQPDPVQHCGKDRQRRGLELPHRRGAQGWPAGHGGPARRLHRPLVHPGLRPGAAG